MRLVRNDKVIRATQKSYEVLYKDRGFKPEEEVKKEEFPAYDDVVKADIRKMLDDKGIEYNERDNKSELYELLVGSD